jgi:hypothetical protein
MLQETGQLTWCELADAIYVALLSAVESFWPASLFD